LCGISDYPISPKITGAGVDDVEDMKRILTTRLLGNTPYLDGLKVKTLMDKQVTVDSIENAISEFDLKPQDMFFFLFAGHGGDEKGMRVLTSDKMLKEEDYNYSRLFEKLDRKNAYKIIVILHACYSGDAKKYVPSPQKYIVMASSAENKPTGVTSSETGGQINRYTFIKFFIEGISKTTPSMGGFLGEKGNKNVVLYPADISIRQRNGIITSYEAFEYAKNAMKSYQTTAKKQYQEPVIFPEQISEEITIFTYNID
jgi:hypothetical protein